MCSVNSAVFSVLSAQQNALSQMISISVTAKQLDLAEQQGEAMKGLLEAAVQLSKPLHAGGQFDAQA